MGSGRRRSRGLPQPIDGKKQKRKPEKKCASKAKHRKKRESLDRLKEKTREGRRFNDRVGAFPERACTTALGDRQIDDDSRKEKDPWKRKEWGPYNIEIRKGPVKYISF